MKVIITPRAEAQLATRRAWWRKKRLAAPDLFDEELADAVNGIASAPWSLPVFSERAGHQIRRRLLPRTRCHLYFEIHESRREVWIVAAGGGQRRRPPPIKLQDAP
ncbi:MAG TPA: hypothetical protein VIF57_10305 [Polyangia bacterium]|jgi:plasmid stabilization system protein ParE